MFNVTDVNGVKIVQELIAAAKSGGGYVSYVIPKFDAETSAPKLSYVEGIPEWEWYIGHGVYVDAFDQIAAIQRAQAQERLFWDFLKIVGILMVLAITASLVARRVARVSREGFDAVTAFFDRAAEDTVTIDPSQMGFSEFEEIAVAANRMIAARQKTDALDELLTQELRLKNDMLGHEITHRREAERELNVRR